MLPAMAMSMTAARMPKKMSACVRRLNIEWRRHLPVFAGHHYSKVALAAATAYVLVPALVLIVTLFAPTAVTVPVWSSACPRNPGPPG